MRPPNGRAESITQTLGTCSTAVATASAAFDTHAISLSRGSSRTALHAPSVPFLWSSATSTRISLCAKTDTSVHSRCRGRRLRAGRPTRLDLDLRLGVLRFPAHVERLLTEKAPRRPETQICANEPRRLGQTRLRGVRKKADDQPSSAQPG